jgi:hypothetical protein
LLDAPERGRWVRHQTCIQANHANFQRRSETHCLIDTFGEHIANQPRVRVVCQMHHLVLIVEGRDGRDRTEDLGSHQFGIAGNIHQDGRCVEVSGTLRTAPAGEDAGTLGDSVVHQTRHLVHGCLVNEGPNFGPCRSAVAHLQLGHPLGEFLGEFLCERTVYEDAIGSRACFAHVPHLGLHGAINGAFHLRV